MREWSLYLTIFKIDRLQCVLAGIIVVALKGMFLQALEFPKFWRIGRLHGLTWITSFLATVLLDIAYGLAIGIMISTIVLLWRSNRVDVSVLGSYANSDLYIDVNSNDHVSFKKRTNNSISKLNVLKILFLNL